MQWRRQDGQIIPALVVVMLAVVAVGMLFFQVGRASIFSTEAQTAADAAALAAVKNVQQQLESQVATTGTSDLSLIDYNAARTAAEDYAEKNGAHVVQMQPHGVDIKVWVSTDKTLGKSAKPLGEQETHGLAKARARIDLVVPPGADSPGTEPNMGPTVSGGNPVISQKEWDQLGKQIHNPPQCGTDADSNDLVKLGRLLQKHGFETLENAELGDPPGAGVHVEGSYHYQCRDSGAIDVNHDQGDEAADLDAILPEVQKLGFRTIWRTTGHFNHMHIDMARSGSIGAGFGSGGAVGPLQDTVLDVRLIDWNAAYEVFGGLGGEGGSGTLGGPPDPAVAHTICMVLNQYNASPKVQLSAFEAAIVESGVHNLDYGDRDSLGVYQQRPSVGAWGTAAQILNPEHAAMEFITHAIADDEPYLSAGLLAQKVQVSAYPYRYDGVQLQAAAMLTQFCGGGGGGGAGTTVIGGGGSGKTVVGGGK